MRKAKDIIGVSATRFAQIIAAKRGRKLMDKIAGDSVEAEVNHGRWIVRCPYCSGAEIADPDDPVFMCLSCFNEENGGHFRPVSFPIDFDKIEVALNRREKEEHQNWILDETFEDLEKETREKGGQVHGNRQNDR